MKCNRAGHVPFTWKFSSHHEDQGAFGSTEQAQQTSRAGCLVSCGNHVSPLEIRRWLDSRSSLLARNIGDDGREMFRSLKFLEPKEAQDNDESVVL